MWGGVDDSGRGYVNGSFVYNERTLESARWYSCPLALYDHTSRRSHPMRAELAQVMLDTQSIKGDGAVMTLRDIEPNPSTAYVHAVQLVSSEWDKLNARRRKDKTR